MRRSIVCFYAATLALALGCSDIEEGPWAGGSAGKGEGVGDDCTIVHIPPVNGPAFITPVNLAGATEWTTSFTVTAGADADNQGCYMVVKGAHFAFDPSDSTDRIEVELLDANSTGQDFVFSAAYQRFTPTGELSGSVIYGLKKSEYWLGDDLDKLDIQPLQDQMHWLRQNGSNRDQRFSEFLQGINGGNWSKDDTFRYFISPYVRDVGKYQVTLRIACNGGPCVLKEHPDNDYSFGPMPTFCTGNDWHRPGAEEACSWIAEQRY